MPPEEENIEKRPFLRLRNHPLRKWFFLPFTLIYYLLYSIFYMYYWTIGIVAVGKHIKNSFIGQEKLKHVACLLGALMLAAAGIALVVFFPPIGVFLVKLLFGSTIFSLVGSWLAYVTVGLTLLPFGVFIMDKVQVWEKIEPEVEEKIKAHRPNNSELLNIVKKVMEIANTKLTALSILEFRGIRITSPLRHTEVVFYNKIIKFIHDGDLPALQEHIQKEFELRRQEIDGLDGDKNKKIVEDKIEDMKQFIRNYSHFIDLGIKDQNRYPYLSDFKIKDENAFLGKFSRFNASSFWKDGSKDSLFSRFLKNKWVKKILIPVSAIYHFLRLTIYFYFWEYGVIKTWGHIKGCFTGNEKLKHFACFASAIVFAAVGILIAILFPPAAFFLSTWLLTSGFSNAVLAFSAIIVFFAPLGSLIAEKILHWDDLAAKEEKTEKVIESTKKILKLIEKKINKHSMLTFGNTHITHLSKISKVKFYKEIKKHASKYDERTVKDFLQKTLERKDKQIKRLFDRLSSSSYDSMRSSSRFAVYNDEFNKLSNTQLSFDEKIKKIEEGENKGPLRNEFGRNAKLFNIWKKFMSREEFCRDFASLGLKKTDLDPEILKFFGESPQKDVPVNNKLI